MSRYARRGEAVRQVSPGYRFALFMRNKGFRLRPALAAGVVILKALEYLASMVGYVASRVVCSGSCLALPARCWR